MPLRQDSLATFLKGGFQRIDRPVSHIWVAASALLAIQLLMASPFLWSGNEENYFALALQSVSATVRPYDAVFDNSHGKFVGLTLFGVAVDLFGDERGRFIVGILAFGSLALGLAKVARALGLSIVDVLVALAAFLICGQTLMGSEWFIGAIETKTFAYGFGLCALAEALEGRTMRAALWCVAAAYFHFLVGGFWIAAILIATLANAGQRRRALPFCALVLILITPVLIAVGQDFVESLTVIQPAGTPSADYIYSILRAPHHLAPFAPGAGWKRGAMAGLAGAVMIAALLFMLRDDAVPRVRQLALTVAILALWLPVALTLSWLDRDTGALGKLYMFRPASPILLLALLSFVALWRGQTEMVAGVRFWPSVVVLCVLASAIILGPFRANATRTSSPVVAVADAMHKHIDPATPVLLDPATDNEAAIRRLSDRQTVVSWKFVPTNPRDIYRWWALLEMRKRVFAGRCPAANNPVRFLVATPATADRIAHCGRVIWSSADYRLIAI